MLWKKFFKTREGLGQLVSVAGIFVNILLSGVKLFIGLMSGAISIIADAFNNLSGFKISAKPPDEEHPFGHGRAEYLAGLFVAAGMILVGGKLFYSSVEKIISPEEITADLITIFVLSLSVAAKFGNFLSIRGAENKFGGTSSGGSRQLHRLPSDFRRHRLDLSLDKFRREH